MSPQSCAQVTRRTWMCAARRIDRDLHRHRDVVLGLLVAHVGDAAADEELPCLARGFGDVRVSHRNADARPRDDVDGARIAEALQAELNRHPRRRLPRARR